MKTLNNLIQNGPPLRGKRVLVRVDFNVPMRHGRVADDTRITRVIPTIKALIHEGAKVILLSHFGRPDGEFNGDLSLAPIADALSAVLSEKLGEKKEVAFGVDCIGHSAEEAVAKLSDGDVLLLENVRFHKGEEKNDALFADKLARLGDVYINDTFSCSHRAHASIVGIAELLPSAAGYLLTEEVERLQSALKNPERPIAAIVGGSKISSKIDLLNTLVAKVDYLMIGGGMANTFLYAQGFPIGHSLFEKKFKKVALGICKEAAKHNCKILLPSDVIVADDLVENPECLVLPANKVLKHHKILDIGPMTLMEWSNTLQDCKTLVWNGPLGAFEYSPFDVGTITLSRTIASLTGSGSLNSVAGGGDVLAALSRSGLRSSLSYVSTAGGAFLEWLEGKELPGIKVLME